MLIRGARGITLRFGSRRAAFQRLGHVLGIVLVTAELWFRRHIVGVWGHDISFLGTDKCGIQATTALYPHLSHHATGRTVGASQEHGSYKLSCAATALKMSKLLDLFSLPLAQDPRFLRVVIGNHFRSLRAAGASGPVVNVQHNGSVHYGRGVERRNTPPAGRLKGPSNTRAPSVFEIEWRCCCATRQGSSLARQYTPLVGLRD
jgi:hypothetical protein